MGHAQLTELCLSPDTAGGCQPHQIAVQDCPELCYRELSAGGREAGGREGGREGRVKPQWLQEMGTFKITHSQNVLKVPTEIKFCHLLKNDCFLPLLKYLIVSL